jgi:pentatricopeptide repeat protein
MLSLQDIPDCVHIKFFGEFSASMVGKEVRHWKAGKARQLFQYLVLHRGRLINSERLYDVLWPQAERSAGSSSLKVAVHGLRQVLREHERAVCESGLSIEYRDCGYIIRADRLSIDVEDFQDLVRIGIRCDREGDETAALSTLEQATTLYHGDFLEMERSDWAVEHREYLKSLMIVALVKLCDYAVRADDLPMVVNLTQRILELDRYHEASYRILISAHGQRGEIDRARSWFDLCCRRLRSDLCVEPSWQTVEALREVMDRRAGSRASRRGNRTSRLDVPNTFA